MHSAVSSSDYQDIAILFPIVFRVTTGGEISLQGIADCHEAGIEPYAHPEKMKTFTLRYPESFGERLSSAAAEEQVSVPGS
jgi:predicted HicB family RNase H-like nuclease